MHTLSTINTTLRKSLLIIGILLVLAVIVVKLMHWPGYDILSLLQNCSISETSISNDPSRIWSTAIYVYFIRFLIYFGIWSAILELVISRKADKEWIRNISLLILLIGGVFALTSSSIIWAILLYMFILYWYMKKVDGGQNWVSVKKYFSLILILFIVTLHYALGSLVVTLLLQITASVVSFWC